MALDKPDEVDALGIENGTGFAVLTIADAWDWKDERAHLMALQAKLNAYLNFIESGQIWESYPDAEGKQVVIDVIGRFPVPQSGIDFFRRAADVTAELKIRIRHRHYVGAQTRS